MFLVSFFLIFTNETCLQNPFLNCETINYYPHSHRKPVRKVVLVLKKGRQAQERLKVLCRDSRSSAASTMVY